MIDVFLGAPADAIADHGGWAMGIAVAGFFIGGFVKGAIGFALPTVAVAIGAMVLPPEVAVAYLAAPGLVMNLWQSLRDGMDDAWSTFVEFRWLILTMLVVLFLSTRLLPYLDVRSFSAIMGTGLTVFSVAQLLGWRPSRPPRPASDFAAGGVAGFFGGISGTWGPPILMLLMALDIPKRQFIRTCGITFLLGSVPFIFGHLGTGVLNARTGAISVMMLLPVALGMRIGQMVQDRLDGPSLRKVILVVLVIAGVNFLRRAIF